MVKFFTVAYETLYSLTTLNVVLFTLHLASFHTSNTLRNLLPQNLCTFLPCGFLLPQLSTGWLPQTIQIFIQILPSQWDLPLSPNFKMQPWPLLWHSLCHCIVLFCLYIYQLMCLLCTCYHYVTFPIRMWSFWWQRTLLPRKKEKCLTNMVIRHGDVQKSTTILWSATWNCC